LPPPHEGNMQRRIIVRCAYILSRPGLSERSKRQHSITTSQDVQVARRCQEPLCKRPGKRLWV
jgi:hypothetical protein